jgi:hypothetical protein
MQHFSDVVRIRVYVSRMSAISIGTVPLPDCVDVRPQRCEPQRIVDEEVVAQVGAMVVSVCGPGEFGDSVREAVRRRVCIRSVDFIEEAFSYWGVFPLIVSREESVRPRIEIPLAARGLFHGLAGEWRYIG